MRTQGFVLQPGEARGRQPVRGSSESRAMVEELRWQRSCGLQSRTQLTRGSYLERNCKLCRPLPAAPRGWAVAGSVIVVAPTLGGQRGWEGLWGPALA